MKRWPVSRPVALLWLVVFLIYSVGYLHGIYARHRMISAGKKSYFGELDVPRLQRYGNTNTPLADWPLWNLQPVEEDESGTAVASKSPYGMKLFGDIQALYNLKNPNERWEFFGIYHNNGEAHAVFHNPSLGVKGWIVPAKAEELCPGLRLTEISENRVGLVETHGEISKTWQLTLFPEVTPIIEPEPAYDGLAEH